MMKYPNFNETNDVEIKKFHEKTLPTNVEEEEKSFFKTTKTGMAPQWSYKVKENDGNWAYNVNGYIDFDPD
jgi:hypothetical protein